MQFESSIKCLHLTWPTFDGLNLGNTLHLNVHVKCRIKKLNCSPSVFSVVSHMHCIYGHSNLVTAFEDDIKMA